VVCLLVNHYLPPELDFKKRSKRDRLKGRGEGSSSSAEARVHHTEAIHM
jgi:hypothetical protein